MPRLTKTRHITILDTHEDFLSVCSAQGFGPSISAAAGVQMLMDLYETDKHKAFGLLLAAMAERRRLDARRKAK